MNDSGSNTHRPRAIDPANFRAQATGIGQRTADSRMTGASRAMRVVAQTDPGCLAPVPAAEGLPPHPSTEMGGMAGVQTFPMVVSPTKVNGRTY